MGAKTHTMNEKRAFIISESGRKFLNIPAHEKKWSLKIICRIQIKTMRTLIEDMQKHS